MEIIYFEETDIKTGNFEFIALFDAMNLKYTGMLKDNVREINFVHKDRNAYIEVVCENDIEIVDELEREFYNLNFIAFGEIYPYFDLSNSIDYNANLFLNLDDYTTILVADKAFTQEAIDTIGEEHYKK